MISRIVPPKYLQAKLGLTKRIVKFGLVLKSRLNFRTAFFCFSWATCNSSISHVKMEPLLSIHYSAVPFKERILMSLIINKLI